MFGKKQRYPSYSSGLSVEQPSTRYMDEDESLDGEDLDAADAAKGGLTGEKTVDTEEKLVKDSDLTASVSRNTVFTGNIKSQDNVEIFGEVEGDVTTTAVVKIYGKVNGNVTCGIMVANNANIVGNILSEKSVVLGNNTTVHGNVNAAAVTVSGQVNGNIAASESVCVNSNGAVYGDIATPEMEVCKGAIVFGAVVMEQQATEPEAVKAVVQDKQKEVKPVQKEPDEQPAEADLLATSVQSSAAPASPMTKMAQQGSTSSASDNISKKMNGELVSSRK